MWTNEFKELLELASDLKIRKKNEICFMYERMLNTVP